MISNIPAKGRASEGKYLIENTWIMEQPLRGTQITVVSQS